MTITKAVRRLNVELKQFKAAKVELKTDIAAKRQALADTFEPSRQDQIRAKWDRIIKNDKADLRHERKDAIHDLGPAQFDLSLKQLNRDRGILGLKPLDQKPANTNTVQGCAQALLSSKNVSFWSGLSTGSERKTFQDLAAGRRAFVPVTGQRVMPKLKMMQALVEMSKRGNISINALTGGRHSTNSNHYRGTAVDLGLTNAGMIEQVARKYGGRRNSETTHAHLDF